MEHSLVNRYRQYKAGTARLVNWLVNAARSSQDVTDIWPSLRGAKAAAKQAKWNEHQPPDTDVCVSTSQLLQLAEVVTETSAVIPEEIIRTTRAVIAGRQLCANWHASLGSTNTVVGEQNKTHQHFIQILQQIQHLLERAWSTKITGESKHTNHSAKMPKPGVSEREEESLANMFAGLQVEEPTSHPLGTSSAPKRTANKVTFKLQDDEESKSFAI